MAIADYDDDHILILVENTAGRRLDIVRRDGTGHETYLTNATALNGIMRAFTVLPDDSVLVSKSTAIEKFNAGKSRLTQGANPYINAPAGACNPSATLLSLMAVHPESEKIVYTHAAATPNNKMVVISATGYAAAVNCLGVQAAPSTTALPTRALFHSSGKLLVAYGSTTAASNFIYSYDFNGTTGAISNATAVYDDGGVTINGPSSMAEDTDNNNAMTRFIGPAFITYSVYTRCVADMRVSQ